MNSRRKPSMAERWRAKKDAEAEARARRTGEPFEVAEQAIREGRPEPVQEAQ